ncbi:MAG: chemotaxis protein CheW [Deltaproteobacteria bacterium]|nr:chemotaxis protein CheW [Deltaproteobacteria bacterium]
MTTDGDRLAALRREFDESFARAAAAAAGDSERLVAVRLGGDRFALRVAEIASVHPITAITRLPGAPRGQLGIVNVRGQLAAVYDAATLLGYTSAGEPHRWCALCAEDRGMGLAIGAVEGYLRVERASLRAIAAEDETNRLLTHAFEHEGRVYRVLDVSAFRAAVAELVGARGPR